MTTPIKNKFLKHLTAKGIKILLVSELKPLEPKVYQRLILEKSLLKKITQQFSKHHFLWHRYLAQRKVL